MTVDRPERAQVGTSVRHVIPTLVRHVIPQGDDGVPRRVAHLRSRPGFQAAGALAWRRTGADRNGVLPLIGPGILVTRVEPSDQLLGAATVQQSADCMCDCARS